ncbi:copper homeostasis protein cutC homolog [Culicoides brevitarsis]|uniref:copper homeostasis protein cutC homolog n=1 Tax=Culicoides brevitarsis TaxID=469753 RepID=UPI00307C0B41
MLLEVCVDSIESAINAVNGGAGRLELCSALSEGGLTPSPGVFKVLKKSLPRPVPIFVMIRPRAGNDFHYTKLELDSMVEDIELFRELGADGFVFGALDDNGRIDAIANTTLMNAVDDLPVTFHRCFDMLPPKDLQINALLIAELGFSRILTSGCAAKAENGISQIKQLMNLTSDLIVMPGSGVNAKNLEMILKETGAKEFHASARVEKELKVKQSIDLGNSDKDAVEKIFVCSEESVKELVEIAKRLESSAEPTIQED